MNSIPNSSLEQIVQKLEYYCSYQERCHTDVSEKLRGFVLTEVQKDAVVVHLINNNFLNEERFASVFAIGKFHQKKWGKIRIKIELKQRKISDYLIQKSLKEIDQDEYVSIFNLLSEKFWESITEKNKLKKRKKFCDYLLRKGWESEKVYDKLKELE